MGTFSVSGTAVWNSLSLPSELQLIDCRIPLIMPALFLCLISVIDFITACLHCPGVNVALKCQPRVSSMKRPLPITTGRTNIFVVFFAGIFNSLVSRAAVGMCMGCVWGQGWGFGGDF